MVKPFRLTCMAKGGRVATPHSLNLNHCLSHLLLIGLPEYNLKVINICEMHGTGGREVVVFDQFQRYVEIVRKLKKKVNKDFNSSVKEFRVIIFWCRAINDNSECFSKVLLSSTEARDVRNQVSGHRLIACRGSAEESTKV